MNSKPLFPCCIGENKTDIWDYLAGEMSAVTGKNVEYQRALVFCISNKMVYEDEDKEEEEEEDTDEDRKARTRKRSKGKRALNRVVYCFLSALFKGEICRHGGATYL